eukprot:jgi/Undpi1/8678/HiC_scaffold_25.g11143.m1
MFFNSASHYHGKGKVVVVSGCNRGIGKAVVKQLSQLGYTVIAGCRTEQGARMLQEEVTGIRVEKCDVTKTEDVSRLLSIVGSEYNGKLHALVNNAGISSGGQALIVPIETSEQIITVNLLGTMRMTKMFLPLLVDNPGSRIVFMSSVCGLCPLWGASAYTASKFGIEGYARVLRDELHVFDVQVSIINAGFTDTDMVTSSIQSIKENFEVCPENIKDIFGHDYADRCLKHDEKHSGRVTMDDVYVPTECVCKAVGSMSCGDRYYSGLMANTVFRIVAMFPALCRLLNRAIALAPSPEK